MATFVPAKRGVEYITYIQLPSVADDNIFQVNPTIAAGDFKITKDGGTEANLNDLPVVTPSGSEWVKIILTATEMTSDIVGIKCLDAAGAEWKSVAFSIPTVASQIDDIKTDTGAILIDTAVIGALGAGLTALSTQASVDTIDGIVDTILVDTADMQPRVAAIEIDTAVIGAAGAGLTDLGGMSTGMKAEVNVEAKDVLFTDTDAEPSGIPAATSALAAKIGWLFTLARNKGTQTNTTKTLRNDADDGNIATSAISDDGTTFTRNEWS